MHAGVDCPFQSETDIFVLRHTDSKKWFGVVMSAPASYFYGKDKKGSIRVLNVKCHPFLQNLLQNTYENCVYPAYHMNKQLWISVPLESNFPKEEMEKLLYHSYELTLTGRRKIKEI